MQKVKLINWTQNSLQTMYTACKTCYSENAPDEIWRDSSKPFPGYGLDQPHNKEEYEKQLKLVLRVLSSGHLSIAEHVNYTFTISGISRVLSHQFVRHRHATYSQKSQRYVAYHKPFEYIIPPSIENSIPKVDKYKPLEIFEDHMKNCQFVYETLLAQGIPAEDARYVFPNACETSMTVTFNLHELMHLCNLRLCLRAQWEIRTMMEKVRDEVLNIHPYLKEFLVPKCKHCTEYESCERRKNEN